MGRSNLNMWFLVVISLVSVCQGFVLDTFGLGSKIHTVDELDVGKYLGRWYQMYTSPSVYGTFEAGAECVTADYSVKPGVKNNITVFNSETVLSPTSAFKVTHGFAIPSDKPGQLTVTLETAPLPAPYWVLKLGPEVNGQYQYSIVSDYLKATLFVLGRDPSTFNSQFQTEVLDFLKQDGFTTIINSPIKTFQESDCNYNPNTQETQSSHFLN